MVWKDKKIKKTILVLMTALLACFLFAGPASAEEAATKDEAVAKAKEAAELIKEKGLEEALKVIGDKEGPFVWKDTYVFAIDIEKQMVVAHPVTPALVGKNLMGLKDVNGKMFFAEFINTAKEKGEGWVDYMWPKPGEKTPSPKLTYVYLAPGTTVFLAAGVYE